MFFVKNKILNYEHNYETVEFMASAIIFGSISDFSSTVSKVPEKQIFVYSNTRNEKHLTSCKLIKAPYLINYVPIRRKLN